jgi:hypothetical protein
VQRYAAREQVASHELKRPQIDLPGAACIATLRTQEQCTPYRGTIFPSRAHVSKPALDHRTRQITAIREDVRLNSGLWELARARAA